VTLQSAELAVLLLLAIVTGGLGWLVSRLIRQGRDAGTARKDEQTRLTETLAVLAVATKENHDIITSRLGALEVGQSAAAQTIFGAVTELREARREAKDSHTDVLRELAGVASTSHDGEERLQSAIDGLAASQREGLQKDMKTVMAVLDKVATDVRSLKPEALLPVALPPKTWVLGSQDQSPITVSLMEGPLSLLRPSEKGAEALPERVSGFLTNICRSLFGSAAPQSFPGVVSAADGLIRTRIMFSPEVMSGLANGTYEHMRAGDGRWLALASNAGTGRAVEIGHLVTSLNPLAVTSLLWQVATFVTAQHHLAYIRQELSGLRRQFSFIEVWLSSKEMGSLQANFDYLDQIDHFLETGKISRSELSNYLGAVDDMERNSLASCEAAKIRIKASQDEVAPLIEDSKKFENQAVFRDKLKKFEDDCNIITASLFVRARAANTRQYLSLNSAVTEHRMTDTKTILTEMVELTASFCDAMAEVTPDPAWMSLPETKRKFHQDNQDLCTNVQTSIKNQLVVLECFQDRIKTTQGGAGALEFEVEYDPQEQSVRSARRTSIIGSTKVRQIEAIRIGEKGE